MALSADQHRWLANAYKVHAQQVFGTCLRFAAGDRAWAFDRMQDVFVKLAEDMQQIRDDASLGGWLYRAACNTCLMSLRRNRVWDRVRAVVPFLDFRFAASADKSVRAQQELSRLDRALATLPAKQRMVFVLVYLEEKAQNDVAELLGLSKGQVSKLHAKALEALRALDWDLADD